MSLHHAIGVQQGLTPQMVRLKALVVASGEGPTPSYQEMAAALGLASRSGIVRLVNSLVERGHLARTGHRRYMRSLRVIQHSCPHCGGDLLAAPLHPASNLEAIS